MESGNIKNLIKKGLKPRRGIPGLILDHFSEIIEARELGWTWRDIAEAMGRPEDEKAMSTAFWKIKKRFESGKLKVPGAGKETQNGRKEQKKESLQEKKPFPFERACSGKESKEDFFENHRIDKPISQ